MQQQQLIKDIKCSKFAKKVYDIHKQYETTLENLRPPRVVNVDEVEDLLMH